MPIIMVMASIGVMFLLNGLVRLLYGAGDRSFFAPADGDPKIQLIRPREFKAWTGLEEGIALSLPQVLATLLAVVLMLSFFIFRCCRHAMSTTCLQHVSCMSSGAPLAMSSGAPLAMSSGAPLAMAPGAPLDMAPGAPGAMAPGAPGAMALGAPGAI